MNERELFLCALEIDDPAARQAHLHTACADDADLLARVEALLASHESQSRFLNTPVVEQLWDDSAGRADTAILFGNGSPGGKWLVAGGKWLVVGWSGSDAGSVGHDEDSEAGRLGQDLTTGAPVRS